MSHQLSVNSIAHCVGRRRVLEEMSFECLTGEVVGLFGRNGCGKSTLLNILFGTVKPLSGTVRFDDAPLLGNITRRLVGYSHQEIFLPLNLTVRDLIPLYFPSGEDQNKIFYSPGVHAMETNRIGKLSLGEQRYLQFLLIVHSPHPFVLLDEPFSMIEPVFREVIKERIREQQAVKGFIITDHYYKDVLDIATKKFLMQSGKLVAVNDEHDLSAAGYLPIIRRGTE